MISSPVLTAVLDWAAMQLTLDLAFCHFWSVLFPFSLLVLTNLQCLSGTTVDNPSLVSVILRVLPTLWLVFSIKYLNSIFKSSEKSCLNAYTKRIFNGLTAAVIGDVCLVWPHNRLCLSLAICAFNVTHCCYTIALGFNPIKQNILFAYSLPIAALNLLFVFNRLKGK